MSSDKTKNFKLRLLTANDVYKAHQVSSMKYAKTAYKGQGVTKCIFPGDFLGGSLFAVSHEGRSMLEVFNQVGFDYVTIGNHEFDYGSNHLQTLMDMSNFKWLGSNIRDAHTNNIFHTTLDYDTFTINDDDDPHYSILIGVFGVCTQETPMLSSPGDDVIFEDVLLHTQRIVQYLKNDLKCDLILAFTHVSLEQDKLIAEIGNIDIILGGHDHEPYILEHREKLIMKCGQNLEYIGILDLDITCTFKGCTDNSMISSNGHTNGNSEIPLSYYRKKIVSYQKSLQLISTYNMPTDPEIDHVIKKWKTLPSSNNLSADYNQEDMDEILTIVDEFSSIAISTKTADCRRQETAFCCYLADAYKWLFETKLGYKCDIAIQNGGFIRADNSYKPGMPITRSIILEELPFQRTPVLLEMKGSDIVAALEQMLPNTPSPPPLGSYPQLSNGITAEYDLNYHQNNKSSKVYNIKIHNQDIDMNRIYHVATTSFYVYECGDNVIAFHNKPVICEHHELCSDVMIQYLKTLSFIQGEPPKRLIQST